MADKQLNINEIRKILPHRYPFLLIDKVLDYEIGESLVALKNVTTNEPFFQGHFPHYPVMPGVLILEAMAQSCAILASLGQQADASEKHVYLFVGADNVRFRNLCPREISSFSVRKWCVNAVACGKRAARL